MSSNGQPFARRPDTMFSDYRYPMPASAQPVEGAKYPARWTWSFGAGGKVYFKVNDGVFGKDDRNAKLKEVHLSNMDRNALLNLMQNAIDDPNFTTAQYHVKQTIFGNGGRLNDHPSTLGTFTIVRTKEGIINVGYSKGTYKVLFEFRSPYDSVILIKRDGEAVEDHGLMSRVYVKAFIDYSRKFCDQMEWEGYTPRERKDSNGGGNNNNNNWGGNNNNSSGGNNNWGGNNGGGNNNNSRNNSTPDFDDEEIIF